ncbi:glycosyltransferase [Aeromicrobium wangtongii]|uniref:Glycosyltransferase n=1 Tax=Aeromicrobium wangtongii TaxID=2969247 RepID=A0ABY5M7U4_9ACTN|nr:glycosyltransferase family 2 protein [Aeromicrobium wangtongii]MCD9196715.1 glycosyltransferase [Aeromicrobium wangtongii]UUP14225.1 glycosyltransferase [Aeromicrobium wangtongii]
MSGPDVLARAGAALSLASLGLVAHNLRVIRTPDLDAPAPTEHIAVLLPVRDEASQVRTCVEAVLRAADSCAGPVDVLVLDDGSTDGTAEILADLAASDERLTVLTGAPLPPGWLGKPWACHQLAAAAAPDTRVLVLVDADVTLRPAALSATVDLLRSSGLDLVCPYPRQLATTWSERLVQPLLQWSWMSTLPLRPAERSGRPSMSAANGQLLCVDAAAYRLAGGHAAVRDEVLEDIALLRAVKRSGGRGVVADGTAVATCRMYDGWPALRDGYGKSLWSAFGSPGAAAGVLALLMLVHVGPPVAALRGSRAGLVGYAASVAARALVARRTGGRVTDAWAHPASVLLLEALVVDSFRRRRRGTLQWKGRAVAPGRA